MTSEAAAASPLDDEAAAEPPLDDVAAIERELGVLFRRRHRATLPARSGWAGEHSDGTAYALLRRLAEQGPLRLTVLAGVLELDVSTVSRQVALLQSAGLVARDADPADRRACLLGLTETGRTEVAEVRARRRAVLRRLLAGWPARDRSDLARLLARLNSDLDRLPAGVRAENER